uniref:Uncharacterized protein n=1 Tax=Arundo donax TaxID=35708 RepID=A0A0A9HMW9_ARUDO
MQLLVLYWMYLCWFECLGFQLEQNVIYSFGILCTV